MTEYKPSTEPSRRIKSALDSDFPRHGAIDACSGCVELKDGACQKSGVVKELALEYINDIKALRVICREVIFLRNINNPCPLKGDVMASFTSVLSYEGGSLWEDEVVERTDWTKCTIVSPQENQER